MTHSDFLATRQRLGMSRAAFCRALGLSQNAGTAYEHGRKRIPRYIALACAALLYGLPPVGDQNLAQLHKIG